MNIRSRLLSLVMVCAVLATVARGPARAEGVLATIFPEQRRMKIRQPSELPGARLPELPKPPTVSDPQRDSEPLTLSLDDAIRIALENSEVVRVLAGAGATASGSTIYDPAITSAEIDRARGGFDPTIGVQNTFDRAETPQGILDPLAPSGARIDGDGINRYDMGLDLSKTTVTGGTARLGVRTTPLRSSVTGLPLNPETGSSVDLSFTQPLLQGGGHRANLAPIELARIDTERSFYQLKDNVQQLVRGVIEAYWALVFAEIDLWARELQVTRGEEVFNLHGGRRRTGWENKGPQWQAESALENFEANRIASEGNLLRREAALRNILGLEPSDGSRIVPVTPLPTDWLDSDDPARPPYEIDWEEAFQTAQQYRPDLIERKLIIEADQQQLLLARNQALPRVDASALYRWDGLAGRAPDGTVIFSGPGQFTGWQFGVNVSMPLGLRESRAALRQRELALMRDRANLEQALHNVTHLLAETYRELAEAEKQYQAFTRARVPAQHTIKLFRAAFDPNIGGGILDSSVLEIRVAIADWGNAVSSQAQALAQYHTYLATLRQQMGTILETHGIRFEENPYCSIGPAGRLSSGRWYPRERRPGPNEGQYESGSKPAMEAFDLEEPATSSWRDSSRRRVPMGVPNAVPERLTQPVPGMERLPMLVQGREPEEILPPAPQGQDSP
ncbi:MAG: TolC family protein [Planctomycetota bacterium]